MPAALVVIDDLDIFGALLRPDETNAPLTVDPADLPSAQRPRLRRRASSVTRATETGKATGAPPSPRCGAVHVKCAFRTPIVSWPPQCPPARPGRFTHDRRLIAPQVE